MKFTVTETKLISPRLNDAASEGELHKRGSDVSFVTAILDFGSFGYERDWPFAGVLNPYARRSLALVRARSWRT
jgi:hypothetical protein